MKMPRNPTPLINVLAYLLQWRHMSVVYCINGTGNVPYNILKPLCVESSIYDLYYRIYMAHWVCKSLGVSTVIRDVRVADDFKTLYRH